MVCVACIVPIPVIIVLLLPGGLVFLLGLSLRFLCLLRPSWRARWSYLLYWIPSGFFLVGVKPCWLWRSGSVPFLEPGHLFVLCRCRGKLLFLCWRLVVLIAKRVFLFLAALSGGKHYVLKSYNKFFIKRIVFNLGWCNNVL